MIIHLNVNLNFNKMKYSHLLLAILSVFYFKGYSQNLDQVQPSFIKSGLIYTFDANDKSIKGNPYLNETFSSARISADSSKLFNIRYNLVSDEMEMEMGKDKTGIIAINKSIPGISITFVKSGLTYQVFDYLNNNGSFKNGYFVNLTNPNDEVKLLLKESKVFIDSKPTKSGYQPSTPASFKKKDDKYFIKLSDSHAFELKKNKKKIANLFPKYESNILSFIKKNKIKVTKKEDLEKLFNFINTL